ncbi:MAG: aconitase X [Hyphomicrobiales bacterium]
MPDCTATKAARRSFTSSAALPEAWRREDIFAHLIGHHAGRLAGRRVPVISGLAADSPKHALKAITAAASSGGVELWHGVGVTPEAPELPAVFRGGEAVRVTAEDLARSHRALSTARTDRSMRWRWARRISGSPNSRNWWHCSTGAG